MKKLIASILLLSSFFVSISQSLLPFANQVPVLQTVFSDVAGRWRADGVSGSSGSYVVSDISGNGHSMTQVAGTITLGTAANGQAKMTGNTTARLTSTFTIQGWPLTIITIAKRPAGNPCGFFGHQGSLPYNFLWTGFETADRYAIYNNSSVLNTLVSSADVCSVARIGYGSRVSILNGVIQSVMTLATIQNPTATATSLGTEYRGLDCDWQETLVWTRTLSINELDEVHAYVNARYGTSIPLWSSYTAVDEVWMGGQSNSAGRGIRGASDVNVPAEYKVALTGVNIWHGTVTSLVGNAWGTLDITTNNHDLFDQQGATYIGHEETLGKEYLDRTGNNVYIFKTALGGTNLAYSASVAYWDPVNNTNVHNSQSRLFGVSGNNWWQSMRAHQAASRRPNMKGIVWYQGEQDATNSPDANAYAANGLIFFNELKKEIGVGAPPIFVIRIHAAIDIGAQPYRDTVRAQEATLVSSISNATLVSVDSYTLQDGAHINITGQLALGQVIADQL